MVNMEDMYPLNGLRGVCAIAIFLGHQIDMFILPRPSSQQKQDDGNGSGGGEVLIGIEYLQAISLFFLLSGIPLTRLYSKNTTQKVCTWDGTYDFYWKRFARLMPIYYLTLLLNVLVIILCVEQNITDYVSSLLSSTIGCALFLQGWFPSLINVGGVLWQIAVFVYGYGLFPYVSNRVANWNIQQLGIGIGVLWVISLLLFLVVFILPNTTIEEKQWDWWIWHVHCLSRLPHFIAGVLLGEVIEKLRSTTNSNPTCNNFHYWAIRTDLISVLLLVTAIQAPIVQVLCGSEIRTVVSIAFEAILIPLYALWLAGIVLAYNPTDEDNGGNFNDSAATSELNSYQCCWTRRVLSYKPLVALGDASLAIYCLHIVVLFLYTMILAYVSTGDRHLVPTMDDVELRVQATWYHIPIQWILVLTISITVSRWYEAPLRKLLVETVGAGRRRNATSVTTEAMTEETISMLRSSHTESAKSGVIAYGSLATKDDNL